MSFRTAQQSFAAQAATHRADSFAGALESDGCNLQVGTIRFKAAFSQLSTAVERRHHGKSLRCSASISIPDTTLAALSLVIDEDTLVTHLPTGDIYEVVQIGVVNAAAAEKRVLLFRREP